MQVNKIQHFLLRFFTQQQLRHRRSDRFGTGTRCFNIDSIFMRFRSVGISISIAATYSFKISCGKELDVLAFSISITIAVSFDAETSMFMFLAFLQFGAVILCRAFIEAIRIKRRIGGEVKVSKPEVLAVSGSGGRDQGDNEKSKDGSEGRKHHHGVVVCIK